MATSQQFPSIVLFDGVCNLCNGAVAFIIARDHRAQFGFASLQSDAGRRLLRELNGGDALPDTFVLVEEGRMFTNRPRRFGSRSGWGSPGASRLS